MKQLPLVQIHAFNVAYQGLVNVLISDVRIASPFQGKPPTNLTMKAYKAIWDTGATNSVVTQTVVSDCGLQPTGVVPVRTPKGEYLANTYLVALMLPNGVGISSLRVTEGTLGGGIDVLVGMDIMVRGDFALTNSEGRTNFSFRIPSICCIDFVKEAPPTVEIDGKSVLRPGRNDKCPCGSGKKFRKCHGATKQGI